jgi:hypothetical protein
VLICVNNSDSDAYFDLPGEGSYRGALLGGRVSAENGRLNVSIHGCSGEIWIPEDRSTDYAPLKETVKNETIKPDEAAVQQEASHHEPQRAADPSKPYEEMTVEELQAEILAKMAENGPVTDRMKQDVTDNVYRDSLLNWVRSFNR